MRRPGAPVEMFRVLGMQDIHFLHVLDVCDPLRGERCLCPLDQREIIAVLARSFGHSVAFLELILELLDRDLAGNSVRQELLTLLGFRPAMRAIHSTAPTSSLPPAGRSLIPSFSRNWAAKIMRRKLLSLSLVAFESLAM